jgi:hypothetical protein
MKSSSLAAFALALSIASAEAGCALAAAPQGAAPPAAPQGAAPSNSPQESQEQEEAPAGDGKVKPEGPRLEFGRAEVKVRNIEQGNAHTVIVRAESVGSQTVHVSKVTIRGEGLSVTLVRKKVGKPIESGQPIEPAVEVPSGNAVRLDLRLDPAGLKVGDHAAVIELETDGNGGKPLVLPVDWEIVEPQVEENDKEEKPLPRRSDPLKELHTKGPPPRLDVEPNYFDFGRVMKGERVKTSFKLRNKGEGDLILQKIGKQCHCTLPRLILPDGVVPKKTLQQDEMVGTLKPGDEATLEVEVDTAGMGGHGHKIVQVFTNDLANNPFSISLELDIDNPFEFSPQSVNIDGVRHGASEKRVVRMSATAEVGVFAINGYELPQPPVFDVEYRKVKPRKNEVCAWELVLVVRDDTQCKEVFGKLKLDLDHPRIHGIDLNYRLRVLPDVDWIDGTNHSPDTITLGLVRPGLNDTRSIFLENKNPSVPYVPTSVTVESRVGTEPFKAELVPIEAGKKYELKFAVVSAPPGRAFNGELVIRSDHPQMKELRLKFSGIWNVSGAPTNAGAGGAAKGN